jgi:ABC-type transport system substrate-binding protein
MTTIRVSTGLLGIAASLLVALAACNAAPPGSNGASSAVPSVAAGSRPSSPAVLTILEPTPNQVVTGGTVHIALSLKNARIVQPTTTNIKPDEGHVHLYVDNVLVSMNYQLSEDLPVHTGTYVIKAEFVASDHAPFNPRVWSQTVVFTVK